MNKISLLDQDVYSIIVRIGGKVKHVIGAIDAISFDKYISDELLYPHYIVFQDKIYDNFDIEINYNTDKSRAGLVLIGLSFIKKPLAYCCDNVFILENSVISNRTKEKEEDHSGQIFNPYTNKWSWL